MDERADYLHAVAGGIDDWAYAEDSRGLMESGVAGAGEVKRRAGWIGRHLGFGHGEEDAEGGFGGDPEEDVALLYLLGETQRLAADDACEGRENMALFELQFRRLEVGGGGGFIGAITGDLGGDLVELVLHVLPSLFAENLGGAHLVGAAEIGGVHLLFGLPLADLGTEGFEFSGLRFHGGAQGAVIESCQFLATFDAIAEGDGDACDASVALGGDVGLLFGYERAGSSVGSFRWFGCVNG
jgi:hypothetical protein